MSENDVPSEQPVEGTEADGEPTESESELSEGEQPEAEPSEAEHEMTEAEQDARVDRISTGVLALIVLATVAYYFTG